MSALTIMYTREFRQRLLGLLWSQWSSLGVYGYVSDTRKETGYIIDPDALFLFTLPIARYDARLWDEVMDWLHRHGHLINVQRMKTLQRNYGLGQDALIAPVAARLSTTKTYQLKWKGLCRTTGSTPQEPLFFDADGIPVPVVGPTDPFYADAGFLRSPMQLRGMTKPFSQTSSAAMLLRMRALFGISLRAELVCALSSTDALYASEAARMIDYDSKSVQAACVDMSASGFIGIQPSEGREKNYYLKPSLASAMTVDSRRPIWLRWGPLYNALERYYAVLVTVASVTDPVIAASEMRKCVHEMRQLVVQSGIQWMMDMNDELRGEDYVREVHEAMQLLCDKLDGSLLSKAMGT